MKLLTKTLAILVFAAPFLSSCYTTRNLNKEDKPFTRDFLSKIESGKRYEFKLKTGQTQTIYVTGVTDETIVGFMYHKGSNGKANKISFSETFENIDKYVDKIYLRKFNPYLTATAVVVPTTLFIILMLEGLNSGINIGGGWGCC